MLTLYYKPTCPFSRKVLAVAEELGISLDLKNIKSDEELKDELIEKGGKKQTPFLVDTENARSMYESDKIIKYLEENYTDRKSVSKLNIHKFGGSCTSE